MCGLACRLSEWSFHNMKLKLYVTCGCKRQKEFEAFMYQTLKSQNKHGPT